MRLSTILICPVILVCNVAGPAFALPRRPLSDSKVAVSRSGHLFRPDSVALAPRKAYEFDPTGYGLHYRVHGTPYWIALNYGASIASWLATRVLNGIAANMDDQIANFGGGSAIAPQEVACVFEQEYPAQQFAIQFGLSILRFGIRAAADMLDVRAAMVAVFDAVRRNHPQSLAETFVIYGYDPNGNLETYFRGQFVSANVPYNPGGGRKLLAFSGNSSSLTDYLLTLPPPANISLSEPGGDSSWMTFTLANISYADTALTADTAGAQLGPDPTE